MNLHIRVKKGGKVYQRPDISSEYFVLKRRRDFRTTNEVVDKNMAEGSRVLYKTKIGYIHQRDIVEMTTYGFGLRDRLEAIRSQIMCAKDYAKILNQYPQELQALAEQIEKLEKVVDNI